MTQSVDLANAINTFVKGCKTDGTWDAIKACCIIAAWDGLTGALYPLKGPAPTNNGFVAGDYNRETGLVGNGSTKYLNTNRSATADPLLNCHAATWLSSGGVGLGSSGSTATGAVVVVHGISGVSGRMRNTTYATTTLPAPAPSFVGFSRTLSTGFTAQGAGSSQFAIATAVNNSGIGNYVTHRFQAVNYYDSRLAFYSIGESLDLALLDARVSTLMTDIGAAIP